MVANPFVRMKFTLYDSVSLQVLSWTGLSVPRDWNLLNLYYNPSSMSLEVFQDEELEPSDGESLENPPLVQTTDVKQIMDLLRPWLYHRESFLLIGPEGSGKSYVNPTLIQR